MGNGALLLQRLNRPKTVVGLWHEARQLSAISTFQRFVLTLDFLFAVGAISMENGLIVKNRPAASNNHLNSLNTGLIEPFSAGEFDQAFASSGMIPSGR
jgi:nitrogen fixation protein FixH